jgi:hypothetical protein
VIAKTSKYGHLPIASKDFAAKTLKGLAAKGIFIVGASYVFSAAELVYHLDDHGTMRIRNYEAVIKLSQGGKA